MQIVAADVGNSSIKLARVPLDDSRGPAGGSPEQSEPQQKKLFGLVPGDLPGGWVDLLHRAPPLDGHWFVSSVNREYTQMLRELAQSAFALESWYEVTRADLRLTVDVENPETTGIDRLLAAEAARFLHAGSRDAIVIDCGTAMTIDLVTRDNTFRGGLILAGPKTSLRALASMTAALPDLSSERLARPAEVPGRSTRAAMLAGTWLSGLGAIRESVARLADCLDTVPLVVGTGGGLDPWRDDLPKHWKVVDNLVIDGLLMVARRALDNATKRGRLESSSDG
jgi:type III pantothenate kinase